MATKEKEVKDEKVKKGQIGITTENIFPIIKKFLYSDHEIFLRELVSNAVDATQKLKTLKNVGELKTDLSKLQVEVILDKDKGTITIRDNGIGMTKEEVEKYINQIAFSGAEEFVNKYKDAKEQIIGHFGLGFYSSFMVSKNVEIISRSQKPNSEAVRWECDGSPEYTLEKTNKKTKGTDVILHIADDSLEFLDEGRIQQILNKYCKFLPVSIKFGKKKKIVDDPTGEKDDKGNVKTMEIEVDNIVNNPQPAWIKKPADLSDEDYKEFYHELYPTTFEDPLFHIHLNVDYPFNLTGILYFPKLKQNIEIQRNKIGLYSSQVFITDNVENIVPEFLTLLHGVIDSPDIPLNVSRSYLQADGAVKKISGYITKKVADKLNSMFKENRADFEAKWDDIKIFIEYGILMDEKFEKKAKNFTLYKNVEGKYFTYEEYFEKIKEIQKDKNDKVVILYATDKEAQYPYVQSATSKGYDVLEMDGPLTSHLVSKFEQSNTGVQFARVDSDVIDKLIAKDVEVSSILNEDEQKAVETVIEKTINKEKFTLVFENLSATDVPMMVTQSEFMRRMKEQQALGGGGMQMFGAMPETFNLVVNSNHPVISKIKDEKDKAKQELMTKEVVDLALLTQGLLKGKELTEFIQRTVGMLD